MLETTLRNKIIKYLIAFNPSKIIIFGSHAYGNPYADSDIDLLIIKDIPENEVRNCRLQIKKKLWQEFGNDNLYFDILVDSEKRTHDRIEIGDLFYEEIYNRGQVIYA